MLQTLDVDLLLATAQRLLPALFRFIRDWNVRRFVGVLRKTTRGLAQIMKMFFVALAPAADQIMNTLLDAHTERQRLIHRLRQDAHHLAAFRRVLANEDD